MEAMQIVRIDFKLELGALAETVEVSGEAQVLQTESATVGEVISGTTLTALPLNGRNTGQLVAAAAGCVSPNPSSFTAIRNFGGGRPFVNGNREQTNNYTIDGVDMNESIDNLVALSAESRRAGRDQRRDEQLRGRHRQRGRRGHQQRHQVRARTCFTATPSSSTATARWTRTPGRTTARARPSPNAGRTSTAARLADRWSKNKLFFFGNYQGTRFDAPGFETMSVAPATWRAGDLSSLTTATIRDPVTGVPFPGNQIPADRISPIARTILSNTALYPLPNRTVTAASPATSSARP